MFKKSCPFLKYTRYMKMGKTSWIYSIISVKTIEFFLFNTLFNAQKSLIHLTCPFFFDIMNVGMVHSVHPQGHATPISTKYSYQFIMFVHSDEEILYSSRQTLRLGTLLGPYDALPCSRLVAAMPNLTPQPPWVFRAFEHLWSSGYDVSLTR